MPRYISKNESCHNNKYEKMLESADKHLENILLIAVCYVIKDIKAFQSFFIFTFSENIFKLLRLLRKGRVFSGVNTDCVLVEKWLGKMSTLWNILSPKYR